ncbi:Copine_I [Hexamita inflata]|uniref:Copine I n=1 Tax=Hexamita inflata TaxID=28002 RepID=A0AA86R8Z7_9EUKA|nr:Copine I [Hexamita inflata]
MGCGHFQALEETELKFSVQTSIFFSFSKSMTYIWNQENNIITQIINKMQQYDNILSADELYDIYRFGCIDTGEKSVLGLSGNKHRQQITLGQLQNQLQSDYIKSIELAGNTSMQQIFNQMIKKCKRKLNISKELNKLPLHMLSLIFLNNQTCTPIQDATFLQKLQQYPVSIIVISFDNGLKEKYYNLLSSEHSSNTLHLNIHNITQKLKKGESVIENLLNQMILWISQRHKYIVNNYNSFKLSNSKLSDLSTLMQTQLLSEIVD